MLFYDCKVSYKLRARSALKMEMEEKSKRDWGSDIIQDINDSLNENADEEKFSLLIYRLSKENLYLLVISLFLEKLTPEKIQSFAAKNLSKN